MRWLLGVIGPVPQPLLIRDSMKLTLYYHVFYYSVNKNLTKKAHYSVHLTEVMSLIFKFTYTRNFFKISFNSVASLAKLSELELISTILSF
jgi:hypothetical protein